MESGVACPAAVLGLPQFGPGGAQPVCFPAVAAAVSVLRSSAARR